MKIVPIIFVYLRPLLLWLGLWYHNIPTIHSITAWQMIWTPKVMQLWPLIGCKEKRGRIPKPQQKAFCLNTTDLFYTKLPSKNTTHTPCGCSFLPFIRHGMLLPAETSFCARVMFSRTLRYTPHSSRVFTELVFQPTNRCVPCLWLTGSLFYLMAPADLLIRPQARMTASKPKICFSFTGRQADPRSSWEEQPEESDAGAGRKEPQHHLCRCWS